MAAELKHRTNGLEFRAKLPGYVRYAAIGVLALTVLAIAVGFYRARSRSPFRLKSEHTQLSTDVVAEVTGYQRFETDGSNRKYSITADQAKTFSDNHQEFENVSFELFGEDGAVDKLKAERGLYVPGENKDFTAYLAGNVDIETKDSLRVKTSNVVFTKQTELAEADELVEFERDNIRGRAFGAGVRLAEKRLELYRDVEFDVAGEADGETAAIRAGSAVFDQVGGTLDARDGIRVKMTSAGDRNTDLRANRASVSLAEGDRSTVRSAEMFDNVWIEDRVGGARRYTIEAGYAKYERPLERFTLDNAVHIVAGDTEPADMRAAGAVYEQVAGKVRLSGGAEVTRGAHYIKGDVLVANLSSGGAIKDARSTGSAYFRTTEPARTTEILAGEIAMAFAEGQLPQKARASGEPKMVMTPTGGTDYTKVTFMAASAINALYKGGGSLDRVSTDGRTTIRLDVPDSAADAANKQLTADVVNVRFDDGGRHIRQADAAGNGELLVQPIRASVLNYVTTVFAPRFDCEFYEGESNARSCKAATATKTVREPTVRQDGRGTQTLTSQELLAAFGRESRDIETLTASGSAKFVELERSATASTITFTEADKTVRLRGGEPTAWDGISRAKAREIDWNTNDRRSYFRGGVSTTYYSRRSTGDAVPFREPERPVFVTADSAEFDHNTDVAVYTGGARGWQDDNYVRANRFTIFRGEGRFVAEGAVQSMLYDARETRKSGEAAVPVYASSYAMTYVRGSRLLQYRKNVNVRQGSDRMTAESADVYLDEQNELVRTVAETNVVLTRPGRKATGNWIQYTASDEVAVIKGDPARVEDAESGTSQGGQLSVNLKNDKVIAEGRTKQNPAGRTRSVYRVRSGQ